MLKVERAELDSSARESRELKKEARDGKMRADIKELLTLRVSPPAHP